MSLRGCSKLFQLQVSFVVVVVVVVLFSFKLRGHRYASTFPYTLRYKVIATKGRKRNSMKFELTTLGVLINSR